MGRKTNRLVPWLLVTAALAGLAWAFPPVRIRSTSASRPATQDAPPPTGGQDFVETFWRQALLPAAQTRATDAAELTRAIAVDPRRVRQRYGRTIGLSSSYFLFLRGSGHVTSADSDTIAISLKADGTDPDLIVPLGFVFGNAVRDGTGLLDPGRYPNAQEFNDLSARLNDVVERQVLPEFQRIATVGRRITFAGCAEIADEETDLKPLKLVPVYVKPE